LTWAKNTHSLQVVGYFTLFFFSAFLSAFLPAFLPAFPTSFPFSISELTLGIKLPLELTQGKLI
jgi:hypothetical protein